MSLDYFFIEISRLHNEKKEHHSLLDSISGSRQVSQKVPSRYYRRIIWRHLVQNQAPLPFAITNSSIQMIGNDHEALMRNLPYLLYHRSTSTSLPGCFVVINYHMNVWISPGASESALSILQKVHLETLAPESGTTPFWTPFLDLAR